MVLAGGLGIGTLILCCLLAFAFLLALIGFQVNRPIVLTFLGFSIFLVVLIIFAAIPKDDTPTEPVDYDELYVTRALITTILSVFAAVGLVVVLIELGLGQVKASFASESLLVTRPR